MMSPYDFDNLAGVAKDRHEEMWVQAQQQQLLKEATPASPRGHGVWHRLQEAVAGFVRHAGTMGAPGTRHSAQHH